MAQYISLMNWTEQGVQNIREWPGRLRSANAEIESLGGRLINTYVTMGDFDLVVIMEWPDDEAAARGILAISQKGNVRFCTMKAWPADEFVANVISQLP